MWIEDHLSLLTLLYFIINFINITKKKGEYIDFKNDKRLLFMSAVKFLWHGLPTAYKKQKNKTKKKQAFSAAETASDREILQLCATFEKGQLPTMSGLKRQRLITMMIQPLQFCKNGWNYKPGIL